jgi:hypothetical protein
VYFSDEVMAATAEAARRIGSQWIAEAPLRVHSSSIAADGSPEWHPSFARWLMRSERPPALGGDETLRTTRVMRKLRKVAVREYEVCYRLLILHDTVASTTRWLNERARANGIPLPPRRDVHYVEKDTIALFVVGIDWADAHW